MTIITHYGKVVLAWAGPCPGVEAELTKARRGEDGYAVIDGAAWAEVQAVVQKNKAERHLRGGEATRRKYLHTASCAAHGGTV